MTVLVTGALGQVGWELRRSLLSCGELIAVDRARTDLADPAAVAALLADVKPTVIVNAAAYTAVDAAETESVAAAALNTHLPAQLAEWCTAHGGLLVHYSTDYVFDGSGELPWRETDAPAPAGEYGRSKLAGEQAIVASGCDHLLLRTAWVYAARGRNFLLTMLRLAAEREELRVVADQFGTPTWARFIADVTAVALRHAMVERARGDFSSGIFHLVAGGYTHWAEFARHIVATAHANGILPRAVPVAPIASSDYPTPARRPPNARLDTSLLQRRFNINIPPWQSLVELCLADYAAGRR